MRSRNGSYRFAKWDHALFEKAFEYVILAARGHTKRIGPQVFHAEKIEQSRRGARPIWKPNPAGRVEFLQIDRA